MARHLLSATAVRTASAGDHSDGDGLYLRVKAGRTSHETTASWVFRYTASSGRRRELGLGSVGRTTQEATGNALAVEALASRIHLIRGQRVILDADLAALYEVETKRLNEQVRRNASKFPGDFMIHLTAGEFEALRSQFATLKTGRGQHRKYMPDAFTEHGALMAAMVLASPRAVEVSVYVVRAFVQLRDLLAGNKELARRLKDLERRLERRLDTHDQAIAGILDAIRQLMNPPQPPKRPIGFVTLAEKKKPSS